jgi:tetratricopeptide (TPR) repeat protein
MTATRLGRYGCRAVVALLSPFLLLLLLELLFAVFGLFPPIRLLRTEQRGGREYVTTNPDVGRLFLPRRDNPMPASLWVPREKTPGKLRVLLIGESAAAGYPLPEYSLARLVEHVWGEHFPEQPVEVINLTMVAVNSHILRLFAREAMMLKPDAVILYAGHNEVIGPFGPVSVFGRAYSSLALIRLNLWVRNLRVGRAVEAAWIKWGQARGDALPKWMGLDEFLDIPINRDDPRLATMARHTEANFRAIIRDALRHQARVLVCLPAVNLNDWPPLGSAESSLSDDEAWAAFQRSDNHALRSAWQVYTLARRCEREGDAPAAWKLYREACDLDLYRFRADSYIRMSINALRRDHPTNLVHFVDVDRLLHEDSASWVSDREYFFEHVHLTFTGRALVAGHLVDGLAVLLNKPVVQAAASLQVPALAERVLFTPYDEYLMWQSIWDLLSLGVFARQPEAGERSAAIAGVVNSLRANIEQRWNAERVRWAYQAALSLSPDDGMLDFIAGRLLEQLKQRAEAEVLVRRGLDRLPNYAEGQLTLARLLLTKGDFAGAENMLNDVARSAPQHPRLPIIRGELYARSGRLELARAQLLESMSNNPSNHAVLVNLATVHMLLHEDVEAFKLFQQSLAINPTDASVLNNMAWLLATSEQVPEGDRGKSLGYVQQAMRLKPDDKRFLSTWALALAVDGQLRSVPKVTVTRGTACGRIVAS